MLVIGDGCIVARVPNLKFRIHSSAGGPGVQFQPPTWLAPRSSDVGGVVNQCGLNASKCGDMQMWCGGKSVGFLFKLKHQHVCAQQSNLQFIF